MTASRVRRAWDGSVLVSLARRAAAGSVVLGQARSATGRVRQLVEAVATSRLPPRLERAIERSTTVRLEREAEAAVRTSLIYRWFTTEPEPDVIVIDLRDTYTVGPVIALVDRLAVRLEPLRRAPRLERVASWFARAADVTADSWTVRAITKLLEPPERRDEG